MFQFNDVKTVVWFPTTVRVFFFLNIYAVFITYSISTFTWEFCDDIELVLTQATQEDRRAYYLFGVLCGLALYNRNFIQLPFPLALFKKLVNAKLTLDDMKEFQPSVGRWVYNILCMHVSSNNPWLTSLYPSADSTACAMKMSNLLITHNFNGVLRSLEQVLNYDDDVLAALFLDFTVGISHYRLLFFFFWLFLCSAPWTVFSLLIH